MNTRQPPSLVRRLTLSAMLGALTCMSSCSSTAVPVHYDIGPVHRQVSTSSPDAQLWFDRGLALCFGFNHEEAIRCFDAAIAADPQCAMAYWGKAYALGPNYNSVEPPPEACRDAFAAIGAARQRSAGCTPVEKALIEALAVRFPSAEPQPRPPIEAAYAAALRTVRARFPDDADVAALTAEAVMQLRPWKLWSPEGEPAPEIAEIRSILEPALARWPRHVALCHFYIHAMEAGPEVRKAIPAARTLEDVAPGLGHLVHMPCHVYTWTGQYDEVIRVNLKAIAADAAYVAHAGRENMYTGYRIHNYHFVAYGAMLSGQRALALRYAEELVREIPAALVAQVPDLVEVFHATPYHVYVRFGMWDEMLKLPEPAAELLATRAVWHYARGVALASLGRPDEAAAEQVKFRAARAAVPASRILFNNPVAEILAVGDALLDGEIEYRRGNHAAAFEHLRKAVELDLALNYDEPWGWMEPARHALGALLTEQKHYAEAVEVYRANLKRYPDNGWALHGLAECLDKLGRASEAAATKQRFAAAWRDADTEIPGSCFCKTK